MGENWRHFGKWNKPNTKRQLLYEEQRVVKFTETESRMVVSKDREGREMGRYCLMSTEFQSRQMKRFWRWAVVMVTQQCEYTKCTEFTSKCLIYVEWIFKIQLNTIPGQKIFFFWWELLGATLLATLKMYCAVNHCRYNYSHRYSCCISSSYMLFH